MSILSSRITSDPLFSCIITFYVLILLYFPPGFSLKILVSPVFIITASILLSLLWFRANHKFQTESKQIFSKSEEPEFSEEACKLVGHKIEDDSEINKGFDSYELTRSFEETFVEWNVRAPLEVIYEGYEGEEEAVANQNDEKEPARLIERYPSLSLYYPESDSDSSSEADLTVPCEWFSPEKMGFRWEEEDKEGLIEIALDKKELEFHGEEDNLIEIDISTPG
ncbi:hypothetical protein SLEP1_g29415 [Rubroshorea leprosula]|uniref:Uncharacterized protein n=1 Tax=Rubroshorea leprosula TaxID=152421 RepID=A0AAV5K6Y7_9ROSI|nr:hypothetical protein SLEP1_g29415 [Rubroshorea leprosula]